MGSSSSCCQLSLSLFLYLFSKIRTLFLRPSCVYSLTTNADTSGLVPLHVLSAFVLTLLVDLNKNTTIALTRHPCCCALHSLHNKANKQAHKCTRGEADCCISSYVGMSLVAEMSLCDTFKGGFHSLENHAKGGNTFSHWAQASPVSRTNACFGLDHRPRCLIRGTEKRPVFKLSDKAAIHIFLYFCPQRMVLYIQPRFSFYL